MFIQSQVGQPSAQSIQAGTPVNARSGQLGDLIVTELHGKFYEQAYRGNLFSIGSTVTALSANTITLTATTTPIIGLYNPSTSTVNAVISKAILQIAVAGNSAVAPGGFVWATSINNNSISTGLATLNRKTLANNGSQVKGFAGSTALTGLTNNLGIQGGAAFGTLLVSEGSTATPVVSGSVIQEFDGSLIIPPGAVLALLNTVSTTTVSVCAEIIWEEIPV